MRNKQLAIFVGFNTSLLEKCIHTFGSAGIVPVFIRKPINNNYSKEYFEKISEQALFSLNREERNNNYVNVIMLFSSLDKGSNGILIEKDFFMPSLIRVHVDKRISNNIYSYNILKDIVIKNIKNHNLGSLNIKNNNFRIPIKNCHSNIVKREYEQIYFREKNKLRSNFNKFVNRIKKTKGLKINNLTFTGVVNTSRHPIRRCSTEHICDIRAKFRFGLRIQDRFEFDVTADKKTMKGKEFFLCDGSKLKINKGVSHLNMRINDDFSCPG